MALTDSARKTIENLLNDNRIVLFMKGSPQTPQCGFSANVAGILNSLVDDYATFNVLQDDAVREGVKAYGNWPTIPQLYIDKELVGGSDIVSQMFNSGELHQLLGLEPPDRTPPEITISEQAADAIRAGMDSQPAVDLHFKIDDRWQAQFMLQPASGSEIKAEASGITLHMDVVTAQKARGVKIGWTESLEGSGLTIDIPAAPPAVKLLEVEELKQKLDAGEKLIVMDVRPAQERDQATLTFAKPLDAAAMAHLKTVPKDTPIAFICHFGNASQSAGEHYRKEGFTEIYNVVGGVDAWAQKIDTAVPRY